MKESLFWLALGMSVTTDTDSSLQQQTTPDQDFIEEIRRKTCGKLAKLPVPNLQETLQQYLLFVKPISSEQQFERTKIIVEEFGKKGGIGEKLQEKLFQRHNEMENWAVKWWLEDMYLTNRAALPVNSNPGLVLPRENFKNDAARLRYAAKLTAGIIDFKAVLDCRALPTDVARGQLAGQPLCMEQYYRLLNAYRIPGFPSDDLVSFHPPSDAPQHIIVACNNQFFMIDVSVGSCHLSESDFVRQFERIEKIANNSNRKLEESTGILTSADRTDWAKAREILMQDPLNQQSLDALERSIFILCLDKNTNARNDKEMAHQMLHGSGPDLNSANRWYDKTVQLIISPDGTHGLSYEHSASEGIAVIALIEHLLNYISVQESKGRCRSASLTDLPHPKQLSWNVNDQVSMSINQALKNAATVSEGLDLEIYRFNDYGKEIIKKQNISPDAYVQVALQVTYYRLYKRLVSTYESASTRRFRDGRVDNIRAASLEALDFAQSMVKNELCDTLQNNPHKMQLLLKATKAQTDFTISAITGYGIDCHLLGLKMMAKEMGLEVPVLFKDSSYDLCNYFQLSTSQIPTNTDSFMCYGPVVPDGYGVSYNPHKDSIVFCVSSFRDCLSTNSSKFAAELGGTLRDMKKICYEWNNRRSASSERIDKTSKVPLYRRLHMFSTSRDNEALRDEVGKPKERESRVLKTKVVKNVNGKDRSFSRHKSLNLMKPNRQAWREISTTGGDVPLPQNVKLSRRYSDASCDVIRSSSLQICITSELLDVLKRENAEFI